MPQITLPVTPFGLSLDILVGVSGARLSALQSAGQQIPSPVQIRAIVDTGASGTAVDASVISALGIPCRGTVPIHTPSTGQQPRICGQFDVGLGIPGHTPGQFLWLADNIPVIETDFSTQPIKALIGMDVLAFGILILNAQFGSFTLAF